ARESGSEVVEAGIKALYTRGVEWFNLGAEAEADPEGRSPLHRPDWRDLIVAQSWANVVLQMATARAGEMVPIAGITDAFYVPTDDPDPGAVAARLGLRL